MTMIIRFVYYSSFSKFESILTWFFLPFISILTRNTLVATNTYVVRTPITIIKSLLTINFLQVFHELICTMQYIRQISDRNAAFTRSGQSVTSSNPRANIRTVDPGQRIVTTNSCSKYNVQTRVKAVLFFINGTVNARTKKFLCILTMNKKTGSQYCWFIYIRGNQFSRIK